MEADISRKQPVMQASVTPLHEKKRIAGCRYLQMLSLGIYALSFVNPWSGWNFPIPLVLCLTSGAFLSFSSFSKQSFRKIKNVFKDFIESMWNQKTIFKTSASVFKNLIHTT